jgi:hypothetical protein
MKEQRRVVVRSEGQTFSREAATDDRSAKAGRSAGNSVIAQPRAHGASHEYACHSFISGLPTKNVAEICFAPATLDEIISGFPGATL